MSPRFALPVWLAAGVALAACTPSVPAKSASAPSTIDYVVFDPNAQQIPLPNDLARTTQAIAAATGAQKEFLQLLGPVGTPGSGFFSDQTIPITIDVQRWDLTQATTAKSAPPGLDLGTLTPATLIVLDTDLQSGTTTPVDTAPGTGALERKFAKGSDRGTLTLRPRADPVTGSRRWKPNHRYAVVLRGGANGAKVTGATDLTAQPTMYLLTRGVDLSKPENQYLLSTVAPTREARAAAGQQLEQIRQQLLPVFAAAEQAWGAGATQQIVSVQVFTIAPSAGTAITPDAVLPSDALLDATTGKVDPRTATDAFCDWSKLDANGSCGLAEGLSTLDGSSTTAMWLAGATSALKASTVTNGSVLVYEVGTSGLTRVFDVVDQLGSGGTNKANYLTQPPPINICPNAIPDCAPVIGLQPATTVPSPPAPTTLQLPPFKEGTQYAVVVTNGVKDVTGNALVRNAFTKLLFFQNPLADLSTGKSLVSALSNGQAVGLERLRSQLLPGLLAQVQHDKNVTADQVVMVYTVKTQGITEVPLQLAAAPYQNAGSFVPGTPADVSSIFRPAVPDSSAVAEMLLVPVPTLNPIDATTGALEPDSTQWRPASLNALVTVPLSTAPTLQTCQGSTLKCAPLVVFHHELTRAKTDVFAIANALASAGFVVAAIDEPLHGQRSLCATDADCTCTGIDAAPTGCTPKCNLLGLFGGAATDQSGQPVSLGQCTTGSVPAAAASGKFFVSSNFFMSRDALREDVLDSSALILAMAPLATPSNPLATELASKGIAVDATKVYWIGQALGGIMGTLNLAANPRLSRGVLNVPGGPLVDVFLNAPSFTGAPSGTAPDPASPIGKLLAGQGITFGTPQYLQFVQVAKWILDPGDPVNFAGHVTADTLPNLLASAMPPQSAKNVFGQYAECDQTIPNPYNLYLFSQLGLAPNTAPNPFTRYVVAGAGTPGACTPPPNNPAHGFLLSPTSQTVAGQTDAVNYLLNLTSPSADRT